MSDVEDDMRDIYDPDAIYSLERQPARRRGALGGTIEVYVGNGKWRKWSDPSGGMAYASTLSTEEAEELMATWDKIADNRDAARQG